MNFDYLDYKKRNRVFINIFPSSVRDINMVDILSKYVGGLIVNEEDLKDFKEQELMNISKLTYTPIFIQKERNIYRLNGKLRKAFKNGNVEKAKQIISKYKKATAAVIYSPYILHIFAHKKLNLPILLNVNEENYYNSYFKTDEFVKECNGFVLNFSDIKQDASIINVLKNYY